MENKCTKCNKAIGKWYVGLCRDCENKQDFKFMVFVGVVIFIFFALLFGAKFMWAKIAYDDWRCMFSECRIVK